MDQVCRKYANTHTSTCITARQTGRHRENARLVNELRRGPVWDSLKDRCQSFTLTNNIYNEFTAWAELA